MPSIDFHKTGIQHLLWKRKVRAFLDDKETFLKGDMLGSARKCELGRWMYSEGIKNYGNIKEIIELEKLHSLIHKLAYAAMENKKNGDVQQAESAYLELDKLSKQLINLLTIIGSAVR